MGSEKGSLSASDVPWILYYAVFTVTSTVLQVKGAFTSAAPISVDTLNYFASLDIPVYEVRVQDRISLFKL